MALSSYEATENFILFSVMNMDGKSGEDLWKREYLKVALNFIHGDIDESEWELYHEIQNSKHHFEILELKKNYHNFTDYVRLLALKNRRRILMDVYSTGYTRDELQKAGISSKRVGKFVKMENKKDEETSCSFLTLLSLYCRVPLHWLTSNYVTDVWDNEHLFHTYTNEVPLNKFIEHLNKVNKTTRAVHGFRVVKDSRVYRVRVELRHNALLIEFYHDSITDLELMVFKDELFGYHCIPGYMRTVIKVRDHRALYCYDLEQSNSIDPPIEFYTKEANLPYTGK